jgi:hypothetical protein
MEAPVPAPVVDEWDSRMAEEPAIDSAAVERHLSGWRLALVGSASPGKR